MDLKFSQRIGQTIVPSVLQIDSMDGHLRIRLWNVFLVDFFNTLNNSGLVENTPLRSFCRHFWISFLVEPIDKIPVISGYDFTSTSVILERIRTLFFDGNWYEVYDLLEFILEPSEQIKNIGSFTEKCNKALEKGGSGTGY
jgi:hypothetical protein